MRFVAFGLSLIFIFIIPWENAVTIGELGTLTRAIGLLMTAFWVVKTLTTGKFRKPLPFHVLIFLFVGWNCISTFWSLSTEDTAQNIKTYLQLAGLTIILWDLYDTPAALRAALQVYVLGAYVSIGSTVAMYLADNRISEFDLPRYAGAGLDANELALILNLGIPVAWHLAVSSVIGKKDYVLRLINYAYVPSALFGTVLTGSRMGLFTIIPGLLFILVRSTQLKRSSLALVFAGLVGAWFVLQTLVPQSSIDRFSTISSSIAERDLGGRVELWRATIAAFSEHPFLGVGSGALRAPSEIGSVAHNTFLSVLAETGLIGLTLFVILFAMAVYQGLRKPKWAYSLWVTVLLGWAIGASALTLERTKLTWLFLSLVVVGASLGSERDKSPSVIAN
jgi:O-antigen ligase